MRFFDVVDESGESLVTGRTPDVHRPAREFGVAFEARDAVFVCGRS
ncbi:MAG: hypothetical protein LLG14_02095 [Nocardiaceae bacterium]|nr:hypothetical protein [Nocardiaceae bacterium]